MKPVGRMTIPICQPFKQGQVLYAYTKDDAGKIHTLRDTGVFFIPMTGAMMKLPPPAHGPATPQPAITEVKTTTE
jgi:protein-L-isoaspartate(D-aspartate) O-methyltransferase